MNVKNIGSRKLSDGEKKWRRYYRVLMMSIGAMPSHYGCGQAKERPEKRLNAERFSTNYKTREEFDNDRETILEYLSRMEYAPEDLVQKVSETVKELDLQFGE